MWVIFGDKGIVVKKNIFSENDETALGE